VSDAPWRVELARTAQHDMRRLDPQVRRRVEAALRELASDPRRAGALRKLTGAPESRLRVGDWRALVMLDTDARTINVTRILPRGRAYRD
jgi:mRNA interferase RelE/StbE